MSGTRGTGNGGRATPDPADVPPAEEEAASGTVSDEPPQPAVRRTEAATDAAMTERRAHHRRGSRRKFVVNTPDNVTGAYIVAVLAFVDHVG
jgi:hypothetical protein